MPTRTGPILLCALLAACGGGSPDEGASTTADGAAEPTTTAGGEAEPEPEPPPEEPVEPVVLRSTTPVPVPQPAVPRDELSEALQAVWTSVEEQVASQRPDAPEENTIEAVQAWTEGPFQAWLVARREALDQTRPLLAEVPDDPPHERALALALWAYAFEDLGAQVAGVPVPERVARDRELLDIYVGSLNEATIPIGERAVELYADCQQRLQALGDDSEWLPWRAYCVQRGQEVIEGYGLEEHAARAEDEAENDAEPEEDGAEPTS
ncbi:MAG TPA: hypothetical protein RMH99_22540 [Sandaracinaceae bacterium LLY-WYZ-13_1]|nr:hypothetical protein [Sandaracinaceae bacterium LLY-WYZ-13_1]